MPRPSAEHQLQQLMVQIKDRKIERTAILRHRQVDVLGCAGMSNLMDRLMVVGRVGSITPPGPSANVLMHAGMVRLMAECVKLSQETQNGG